MNKLSRLIALSAFGLSGSLFAAEDNADRTNPFENLDTDGDGSINFAEFQARGADALSRLDIDGNGALTVDEFLNARPDRGRRGNRNADRPEREPSEEQIARMEERRAAMQERATARFESMDSNGDEIVSLDEYQEANFLALDSDNNGLLSKVELRPKRGGRRGNGPRGRGRSQQ